MFHQHVPQNYSQTAAACALMLSYMYRRRHRSLAGHSFCLHSEIAAAGPAVTVSHRTRFIPRHMPDPPQFHLVPCFAFHIAVCNGGEAGRGGLLDLASASCTSDCPIPWTSGSAGYDRGTCAAQRTRTTPSSTFTRDSRTASIIRQARRVHRLCARRLRWILGPHSLVVS